MRLLMFSNSPLSARGGAEVSFEAISDHLADRGHDVITMYNDSTAPDHAGTCTIQLPWPGFKGRFPTPHGIGIFSRQLLALGRILSRIRPDVVIVHFIDLSSLYFAALRPLLGFRLVLNARGSDLLVQPRESERHRRLLPLALRAADRIVVLTAPLAEAASRLAPRLRNAPVVIPNGIDVPFWSEPVAQADDQVPLMVAAGRLHAVKGFDVLLNAFARVVAHVPGARLRIIGEGEERSALEAQAHALGIGSQVEMPGWETREALRKAYQEAMLVVVPSRSEGLGNVALEAMASGAAVVVSEVGGLPYVVEKGKSGLLVPAEDAVLLADAMLLLVKSPEERARIRAAARERAATFSWVRCLDAYERVLEEAHA